MENRLRRSLISRRSALIGGGVLAAAATVNPAFAASAVVSTIKASDGRSVEIWTWSPAGPERGLILFSHGALSSPNKYERIIGPWTQAGFKVMAPLHVDSADYPDHAHYPMNSSWPTRILDMRALGASVSKDHYLAAGHSYGALIALTMGGAEGVPPPGVTLPMRHKRVTAVVAFSPPGPNPMLITKEGYAGLAVPALIETGDKDNPTTPAGVKLADWPVHLTAYYAAPPGDKYALVLPNVDHYFGGLICNFDRPGPTQPEGLAKAVRISLDFLETYGPGDTAARDRLNAGLGTDAAGIGLSRK